MNLKAIKLPESAKDIITAPLPKEVIFKKPGKGDLDYISITFVTDLLNAAFGPLGWSWETKKEWIQESQIYFKKNTKYFTAPKDQETTNESGELGMYISQPPVAWVSGRLTVKLWDEDKQVYVESFRDAAGSKIINGAAGEQEHIFKSAQSDAMKKAASFFGIGLELARKDPEKEFFEELNAEPLEPVWTDELKAKYAAEWEIINSIIKTNGWSMEDFGYYVHMATEGQYSLIDYMPEEFMSALMNTLKAEGLVAEA